MPEAATEVVPTDSPQGVTPSDAETRASNAVRGKPAGKVAAPKPQGQTAKPLEAPRVERFKMKVHGEEIETEVPVEELISSYQQRSAVGKSFREIAEARKELERREGESKSLVELWKTSPVKAFMKENPTATRQQALEWLADNMKPLIDEEGLSPEAKELRREREKREELEAKIASEAKDRETKEREAEVQRGKELLAAKLLPALKETGMPTSPLTFAMMTTFYQNSREAGLDLSPAELAKGAKELILEHQRQLTETMSGEDVLNAFPDLSRKIHKALIDRYERRQNVGNAPTQRQPRERQEPQQESRRARLMSDAEINKAMGIKL